MKTRRKKMKTRRSKTKTPPSPPKVKPYPDSLGTTERRIEALVAEACNRFGVRADLVENPTVKLRLYLDDGTSINIPFDLSVGMARALTPEGSPYITHSGGYELAYKTLIGDREFVDDETQINMLILQLERWFQ